MNFPYVLLVVLLVSSAGFLAGYITGAFVTAAGMLEHRKRELDEPYFESAPYPHYYE